MGQILIAVLGAILFFAAGAGLGYWFAVGGRKRKRAEEIQQEFDAYRERVGNHFAQTAEHFRTIGREYRALYDHMASGADALCDPQAVDGRLSFMPAPPSDARPEAASADGASDAVSAAAAGDDESTPDQRARGLGGESAPAEDEGDELAAGEADAAAPRPDAAATGPEADAREADSAASSENADAVEAPEPDVAVDETATQREERERTLH